MAPLRDRRTLQKVRHQGRHGRSGPVNVRLVELPGSGRCSVALSVTRRAGTAVVRNRIRRRLRAGLADLDARDPLPEAAMVVSGDRRVAEVSFSDLVDHLERAVVRARAA